MSLLFERAMRLTLWRSRPGTFGDPGSNGVEITDIRTRFTITKSSGKDPNNAEIELTNLAPDMRAALAYKPLRVKLEAGYAGELKHVFTGDLRFGSSRIEQPDWLTKLQLADGDRAYRHARVSKSYVRGTPVSKMLADAAKAMGLRVPPEVAASPELAEQVATGAVANGPARDELTRLLAPYGYYWSIQDGALTILKSQTTTATRAWLISQETGMVGSPEFSTPERTGKTPVLQLKCLLFPELIPGGKIQVQSRAINGIFKLVKVSHTGDTHGSDWQTEVEAKAL